MAIGCPHRKGLDTRTGGEAGQRRTEIGEPDVQILIGGEHGDAFAVG